jgi:methyl-accepting chemotaxis protein
VVQRLVVTMASIRGSSRRVVEIVGVIDGLAVQTHMLALSAAVEAARAGEHGQGWPWWRAKCARWRSARRRQRRKSNC